MFGGVVNRESGYKSDNTKERNERTLLDVKTTRPTRNGPTCCVDSIALIVLIIWPIPLAD